MLKCKKYQRAQGKDPNWFRNCTGRGRIHNRSLKNEWVSLDDIYFIRKLTKWLDCSDSRTQTFHENGREYQSFRRYQYMYPCDSVRLCRTPAAREFVDIPCEQDETFHLDIGHSLFLKARSDKLHSAPITTSDGQTRILDLGTGTGIWVLDMAE